MAKLTAIEGIGEVYAVKLVDVGVKSVEALLEAGSTKKGREELVEKTLNAAKNIAEKSVVATMMIKESINRAFEVSLQEGLRFERRTFHSIFATQDQKEGMQAFVEKRPANFKNQ